MKKVRVFELAKQFGMKGPELAKLLRGLGFENIKTHMTVLDDADLMIVEARLMAQGILRKTAEEIEAAAAPKRKKKKKKLMDAAAAEPEEPKKKALPTKKALPKKKTLPTRKIAEAVSPDFPAPESTTVAPQPVEPAVVAPAVVEPAAVEPAAVEPAGLQPAGLQPAGLQPAAAASAPGVAEAPAPTEATGESSPSTTAPEVAPAAAENVAPVETAAPTAATPAKSPQQVPPASPEPTPNEQPVPATAEGTQMGSEAVKRLLIPQQRATVVGRIELPQETIRDASRRSAPQPPRDLRRAALQKMQQRTGSRFAPQPGARRGPGGPGRGGRDSRGGGGKRSRMVSTVDPNKIVEVEEPVSMKALSEGLGIKVTELMATLTFKLGVAGKTINSFLTNEEVELVALEIERKISVVEHKEALDELIEQLVESRAGEETTDRAPVVTFMGHVDHGKTTLMDALHDSKVAKSEAGGITQHIGAYKITSAKGQSVVVLDTPGHAAFTAMRARGAEITDIVVLVVAADDGVMPQTEEAINHAKAASVPIVVAITKTDLPGANTMQVKQQLMIKGLQSEDFGGEIGMVEVSAVKGEGLEELIDRILLETEILELRAHQDAAARGIVVESRQSPEQGVVVTLLVTDGTLRLKDQIVCGESFARVRAMIDDRGKALTEAGPSTPVTLFGLDRLPTPGDKLFVVSDTKKAKEVVEERQRRVREQSQADRSAVTLETLSARLAERDIQEIKVILKADAMGSLEPLRKCLDDLKTEEVRVNIVHSGLGGINETDVSLAEASGAVIVGFNSVADSNARTLADRAGIEIRFYDVIYELLDQVRDAMEGMLAPAEVESVVGHAEIRATFKSSKFGIIAGCRMLDGFAKRSSLVRLSRDGAVVWSGKLGSLRRIEEDVREVKAGVECGMTLDGYQDPKVGDQLEFVQIELVKRTLGGAESKSAR